MPWQTLAENRNVLLAIIVFLVMMTMACSASTLQTLTGVKRDALHSRKIRDGMLAQAGPLHSMNSGPGLGHQGILGHTGATNDRPQRWSQIAGEGFLGHPEPPSFNSISAANHSAMTSMVGTGVTGRPEWAGARARGVDGLVDDRQLLPALDGR